MTIEDFLDEFFPYIDSKARLAIMNQFEEKPKLLECYKNIDSRMPLDSWMFLVRFEKKTASDYKKKGRSL